MTRPTVFTSPVRPRATPEPSLYDQATDTLYTADQVRTQAALVRMKQQEEDRVARQRQNRCLGAQQPSPYADAWQNAIGALTAAGVTAAVQQLKTPYVHQDYPKWLYDEFGRSQIVATPEHHKMAAQAGFAFETPQKPKTRSRFMSDSTT